MIHKREQMPVLDPSIGGDNDIHKQRLQEEEEIAQAVLDAREKGRTKAGFSRPIPGTSKLKNLNEQRFRKMEISRDRPHDKEDKKNPHRRDTIRGKEVELDKEEK